MTRCSLLSKLMVKPCLWLVLLCTGLLCSFNLVASENDTQARECVVLLHGLARTERAMRSIAEALREQAFVVVNQSYPSTQFSITQLAEETVNKAVAQCPINSRVHFVTHSLGGIVLRHFLAGRSIDQLGHVVMLAPPNQGSQLVDRISWLPGYYWLNGPAGTQLGTGKRSIPLALGPADFSVGIIAGTRTFNPLLSLMLPNPDDGKVSVENTKLEGMSDHISLPVTHTFIMRNDHVISQIKHYLTHGRFDHALNQ